MSSNTFDVVTGAFSYTGKYITRNLLSQNHRVVTLTGHPNHTNPFNTPVQAFLYHFDEPQALTEVLRGADTLYNTYWVRFNHGDKTYQRAVENTLTLIEAARKANVRRIVHVSITNPSIDSILPYFSGKARLEQAIQASGLSYAILRPTVIFGKEDILINNIAYLLRRFPVFAVPGSGNYRLQPVYVEDMAQLAVEAGQLDRNITLDAVGPDIMTFNQLLEMIKSIIQKQTILFHVSPSAALLLSKLISMFVNDVMLTRDEISGLMAGLLVSPHPPTGKTSLESWLKMHADTIGQSYANELSRHFQAQTL